MLHDGDAVTLRVMDPPDLTTDFAQRVLVFLSMRYGRLLVEDGHHKDLAAELMAGAARQWKRLRISQNRISRNVTSV